MKQRIIREASKMGTTVLHIILIIAQRGVGERSSTPNMFDLLSQRHILYSIDNLILSHACSWSEQAIFKLSCTLPIASCEIAFPIAGNDCQRTQLLSQDS